MDRARRGAASSRRKPLAASASPQSTTESSFEHALQSPASPVMALSGTKINTPQTAPQSRRDSRAAQQYAFTFSTPGPGREGQGLKKRSRTMDGFGFADDGYADDGSPKKGGHSLRKRARVDYAFEHIDDEVLVPNSTSSAARNKKRRPDNTGDSEDFYHGPNSGKRRGTSLGADTPSSVRRNPARRSVADTSRAYREDDEVKDTIEVGVSFSDLEESEDPLRAGHSSDSASAPAQSPPPGASCKPAPAAAQVSNHGNSSAASAIVAAENTDDPGKSSKGQKAHNDGLAINHAAKSDVSGPSARLVHPRAAHSPGPAEVSRDPDSELRIAPGPADTPALDSTQDTLQTSSAKNLTQEAISQESRPSPNAIEGEHGSLAQGSELKQNLPEDDEVQPSLQLLQEGRKSDGRLQRLDSHDHHGDATLTAVGEDEQQQQQHQQEKSETTETVSQTVPGAVGTKDDNGEQPHQVSSPQPTERDLLESTADNMLKTQPSSSEQPPTVTVSDAVAQPSSTGTQDSTDSTPDTTSGTSTARPTQLEVLVGAHLFAPQLHSEEGDAQAMLDPSQIRQTALRNALRAHLSPYVDGEHDLYSAKRDGRDENESDAEQTSEIKDFNLNSGMEPMVEDNDDAADSPTAEAATPVIESPARGSPAIDNSIGATAVNSPTAAAAAEDNGDEAYVTASQTLPDRQRVFKYRRIRDPALYLCVLKDYKQMSTDELYEVLDVINEAMQDWQNEYQQENKLVEDCENAGRRQAADERYEAKVRDAPDEIHKEPDLSLKGYKEKLDLENIAEKRYRQNQDKIQAASYGFEWNPDPVKIGDQDPKEQPPVDGIMPRRRSLRIKPKQTAKATESEGVTGKRQRKPVQHFDPAPQKPSRSATPAAPATRAGRKRRNANTTGGEEKKPRTSASSSNNKNAEQTSDAEETEPQPQKGKKQRRGGYGRDDYVDMAVATPTPTSQKNADSPAAGSGRRRAKKTTKRAAFKAAEQTPEEEAQAAEPKQQQRKRHLLTLKMPKVKNFSEHSSAITDNGDSRPSTASSDSTSHTAESSYSFRPKRQKRFRDEPDDDEAAEQPVAKKRGGKRAAPAFQGNAEKDATLGYASAAPEAPPAPINRKKIKLVSKGAGSRTCTPASQPTAAIGEGEDRPKDYKSMTKSEKMSASMKSRWANGNMAGAVEKRKATLAAKKAAQAAADQKVGTIASKPKIKTIKKGAAAQEQHQQQRPAEFVQHGVPGTGYRFTAN